MKTLFSTQSPALPIAEDLVTPGFQNNYSNILRLYFNQIDNFSGVVLGPLGMGYLDSPHIAASDSTDQYADGDDDPTIVKWNTAEAVNGFTLNVDNTAQVTVPGVYKIDYSLQFANTDNAQHDVYVWLQENGTQIPNSCSKFTIPARKSAGVYGYVVAYSSIVFAADPEDKIGLWWATSNAASSNLVTAGVYMDHIPAQTVPYPRPANPSAVGSITFLGRLPPTP